MDVSRNSAAMVIVLLCFMVYCNQATPVSRTSSKEVNPTIPDVPTTPVFNNGGTENKMDVIPDNDLTKGKAEKKNVGNEATQATDGVSVPPSQPGQVPTSDSLLLSNPVKINEDSANDHISEVSKAFTKKVLNAFFAELKNRPELVDEILKRETYRLLMSTSIDDDSYDHLPPGADLTQDLLFGPSIQTGPLINEDIENINGFSKLNENAHGIAEPENEMPKKDTQVSKIETPKSKDPKEGGLTLPTSLTKELDNVEVEHGKADESDVPDVDVDGISLLEPYYYYVYYDENEDPNAEPSGKSEDTPATLNSDNNKGISNNDEIKAGMEKDTHLDKRKPAQGVLVNGLASVVRSVIAKDMEKQLNKSKMALENFLAPGKLLEDVKVDSNPVGDHGHKESLEDEEMELMDLADQKT